MENDVFTMNLCVHQANVVMIIMITAIAFDHHIFLPLIPAT